MEHETGAGSGAEVSTAAAPAARGGRELFAATRPFAQEVRFKSWWFLWSTLAILVGLLTLAALAPWWPVRLAASVVGGLVMVRCFILYHDYAHGAVLRRSWVAKAVMVVIGALLLAPFSSWRRNHNLHHANMGKLRSAQVGGFPLLTVAEWRTATRWERVKYRVSRHPLTIACASFTIFFLAMAVAPLFENWRKHWDSVPSILAHGACVAGLWWLGGFWMAFFTFLLPYFVAAASGAYLFYVQHNFPAMRMLPAAQWTREQAAVISSSHMDLGLIMRWLTGEIGYHHVHHLNPGIPFYRLAETMQALPELQSPEVRITLHPRDVLGCLRLALYDEDRDRMVSYAEAASDELGHRRLQAV